MFQDRRRAVWLLRGTSLWTFWIWGTLVRNIVIDKTHSLGFRVVHMGLALISILLGIAIWIVSNRLNSGRFDSTTGAQGRFLGTKYSS